MGFWCSFKHRLTSDSLLMSSVVKERRKKSRNDQITLHVLVTSLTSNFTFYWQSIKGCRLSFLCHLIILHVLTSFHPPVVFLWFLCHPCKSGKPIHSMLNYIWTEQNFRLIVFTVFVCFVFCVRNHVLFTICYIYSLYLASIRFLASLIFHSFGKAFSCILQCFTSSAQLKPSGKVITA